MTPEFEQIIASYPQMSEEAIKLIFIRDRAKKAYIEDKIRDATSETLKEVITLGTIAGASKDDIRLHIGNLERCRNYLSAMLQGYKIAYAEEIEPILKAKREKEGKIEREKKPKTLEGILAKYGLSAENIAEKLASLNSQSDKLSTPKPSPVGETCKDCGETGILMMGFHKCASK